MAETQKLVEIDDELWAKAKAQAAMEQRTLKEWVVEAIREKLGLVVAATKR